MLIQGTGYPVQTLTPCDGANFGFQTIRGEIIWRGLYQANSPACRAARRENYCDKRKKPLVPDTGMLTLKMPPTTVTASGAGAQLFALARLVVI